MAQATTPQVLAATRQWLKPLVHVLVRCGITWKEFADLAKTAYVEVATARFGKRGRPTNVSRTAVLTGLTRREVRKQRERLERTDQAWTGYVTKGSLVLSTWHQDPDFLDTNGLPLVLPFDGEGATFAELLHRCGAGDVRASTLLKELRDAGALRERPDGRLEALMRNYIPQSMDADLVRLWGTVISDVAMTYLHNLTRRAKAPVRFERAAMNARVRAEALPEFRTFLETEGQAFLERVDAWLTAHQARADQSTDDAGAIRLGAGVYHIQDEDVRS
ncbi:MAG TPA: DUF6502 family protein [Steroidobacteraceae bacterium]|nr:DUF6502 family protein [Steroidobacteraceae bacterium]HQZ80369.1 DUF6502 family protein [Steroidobacteraceae bacterium]